MSGGMFTARTNEWKQPSKSLVAKRNGVEHRQMNKWDRLRERNQRFEGETRYSTQ